eukprot:TRINITY_DN288_c0_g1_i1.p1 TRINITY_DN288_c0_g1~~TRINITY_DN288_c0_g1_i1.p1  ORF type:complete len:667 (+),score=258.04 TRINITY_DN288_c0_g1_i1:110-2002(+)
MRTALAIAALLGAAAARSSGSDRRDELSCRERFLKACPLGSELGGGECLRCLRRKHTVLRGCTPRTGQQWCLEGEGGVKSGKTGTRTSSAPGADAPAPTSSRSSRTSDSGREKSSSSDRKSSSGSSKSKSGFKSVVPIVAGDLFVVQAKHVGGRRAVLASFHGDTNGLATVPVTEAVGKYHRKQKDSMMVFGMDGNTYGQPAKDQQGLQQFADWLGQHGLATVWGPKPDNAKHTTFNARTYLQPQLNKAALSTEREAKGDKNCKDHIVVPEGTAVSDVQRDNTGKGTYNDDTVFPTLTFPSDHGVLAATLSMGDTKLRVATWNVAAINNNPFEYWITAGPDYNNLLEKVAELVTSPGSADVLVSEVFTEAMWQQLRAKMAAVRGWDKKLDWVDSRWKKDVSQRKIISGFLKDGGIGKKRLASMPDRVTNTISAPQGTLYRPTVVNCYDGDLGTMQQWFDAWTTFFFNATVDATGKRPVDVLPPILRKKYPAVTEEEEEHSQPLQLLMQGVFDAILVHMVNKVAPKWQGIRKEMCGALNIGKDARTLAIIEQQYGDADVVFLQEVASTLVSQARKGPVGERFHILIPANFDKSRNQNSVILLNKKRWEADADEVTATVMPEAAAVKRKSKH